jgi:hypothetical protein
MGDASHSILSWVLSVIVGVIVGYVVLLVANLLLSLFSCFLATEDTRLGGSTLILDIIVVLMAVLLAKSWAAGAEMWLGCHINVVFITAILTVIAIKLTSYVKRCPSRGGRWSWKLEVGSGTSSKTADTTNPTLVRTESLAA